MSTHSPQAYRPRGDHDDEAGCGCMSGALFIALCLVAGGMAAYLLARGYGLL